MTSCPTCFSAYAVPPRLASRAGGRPRCARCRAADDRREGALVASPFSHDVLEIVAEAGSARRAAPAPSRREPAQRRPTQARPKGGFLKAVVLFGFVALAMTGVAHKEAMVRLYPPSAGLFGAIGLPVNLRGLALADLHGNIAAQASGAVLSLEGKIRNLRREAVAVPTLRIAVRDTTLTELYSWTVPAPKPKLDAGETIVFRSRLAAPPEEGQDLVVSFADPIGASGVRTERP